jgi:hypothetical protein
MFWIMTAYNRILEAVCGLRSGPVEVVVHDGHVVQKE